jgi:hypothetical protein
MGLKSINLRAAIPLIVLCFGAPSAAKAQGNVALQGGSPAMNYSRDLLKRTDVQNELGLDAVQKEALEKALRKSDMPIVVRPVVNHRDISRLSDEERRQWQAEINRQAFNETLFIMNQRRREGEEILRPDQRKRLTEIDLQWRGILALGDKSLSNRLGVSPEHQERIADILAKFFLKRLPLLNPYEESEATNSPRYQKRRVLLQETEQKVFTLLSDEERRVWSQAIGRPFKFEDSLTQ